LASTACYRDSFVLFDVFRDDIHCLFCESYRTRNFMTGHIEMCFNVKSSVKWNPWILCLLFNYAVRPPLWSRGQEFLDTNPEVRVRVRVLPDFLRNRTEELLGRNSSSSCLENHGDPPGWLCDTSLSAKVGTSFADNSGGHSVLLVRSRTQAMKSVDESRLSGLFPPLWASNPEPSGYTALGLR
jgi:hypothetical protein